MSRMSCKSSMSCRVIRVTFSAQDREDRELHSGVRDTLDFGSLEVHETRSFTLRLSSPAFHQDQASPITCVCVGVLMEFNCVLPPVYWSLSCCVVSLGVPGFVV